MLKTRITITRRQPRRGEVSDFEKSIQTRGMYAYRYIEDLKVYNYVIYVDKNWITCVKS